MSSATHRRTCQVLSSERRSSLSISARSFGRFDALNVSQFNDPAFRSQITTLPLKDVMGLSYRSNIDGFMYMNGRADTEAQWYVQIFNDGTVEIVNGIVLSHSR